MAHNSTTGSEQELFGPLAFVELVGGFDLDHISPIRFEVRDVDLVDVLVGLGIEAILNDSSLSQTVLLMGVQMKFVPLFLASFVGILNVVVRGRLKLPIVDFLLKDPVRTLDTPS